MTPTTESVPQRPGAATGRPPWAALPVLLVGTFLFATDAFIVNVALPTIGRTLHAAPAYLELTVAGYVAAYACCLVTGGRLGDAYGRRRMFMLGMTGFVVASAACGLAPTAEVLVVARLAQGVTAAAMVPQVLATVQTLFQGADRQRALGAFGAVIGSATVAGQILGGAIVSADIAGLSWRPAFLINVPIGLLGLLFARRLVPETRAERALRLDVPGALLLALAVLLLLVPLSVGRDTGWPVWCWIGLAAAPFAWATFVAVQSKMERAERLPLLPPSLLRYPGMQRGLGTALSFFLGVGGFMITTAVSLQSGLGLGPLAAGVMLVPYALGFLGASLGARRLVARHGRRIVVGGAVLLAAGMVAFAVEALADYDGLSIGVLAAPLVMIGVGQAFVMIPLFGVVLTGIPGDYAGVASGVLTTTQQVGIALGTATLGTLFFGIADPSAAHPAWGTATVVVLFAEALLAVVTAVLSRFLPSDREQARR
jgi:MFS family permease